MTDENVLCAAKKYMLKGIENVLSNVSMKDVADAVSMILTADKIFIYGVGRSGLVGKAFAIRLVQLGIKTFFIGETITPIVEPGNVVLIISRSGETASAIQTANIVRRVGAKVIVITARKGSKLVHTGNIVLYLPVRTDEQASKLAPLGTLFEEAVLILLDCMIAELIARMGESEESMKARHAIWV